MLGVAEQFLFRQFEVGRCSWHPWSWNKIRVCHSLLYIRKIYYVLFYLNLYKEYSNVVIMDVKLDLFP